MRKKIQSEGFKGHILAETEYHVENIFLFV